MWNLGEYQGGLEHVVDYQVLIPLGNNSSNINSILLLLLLLILLQWLRGLERIISKTSPL